MTIEMIVKRNGDENNSDAGDEQTHNETSRIRNVASLLILTTWTLGYHVAPEDKRSQFFILNITLPWVHYNPVKPNHIGI